VGLPLDAVERIFTLAFAFEQLRQNLVDLDGCVRESARRKWSRSSTKLSRA
jgi:hypothetical protein